MVPTRDAVHRGFLQANNSKGTAQLHAKGMLAAQWTCRKQGVTAGGAHLRTDDAAGFQCSVHGLKEILQHICTQEPSEASSRHPAGARSASISKQSEISVNRYVAGPPCAFFWDPQEWSQASASKPAGCSECAMLSLLWSH